MARHSSAGCLRSIENIREGVMEEDKFWFCIMFSLIVALVYVAEMQIKETI